MNNIKNDSSELDPISFEKYTLVLYHDYIYKGKTTRIEEPIATSYIIMPEAKFSFSFPLLINEMIDRLKGYMISCIEKRS